MDGVIISAPYQSPEVYKDWGMLDCRDVRTFRWRPHCSITHAPAIEVIFRRFRVTRGVPSSKSSLATIFKDGDSEAEVVFLVDTLTDVSSPLNFSASKAAKEWHV
jgi:hypothetical protein